MVTGVQAAESEQSLVEAQDYLRSAEPKVLRRKLRAREQGTPKIPWLVAEPMDSLSDVFAPPTPPSDFSVVAADGSFIPPDRHSPMCYYVLNVGYAMLTYGRASDATLGAEVKFCHSEDDLYFDPQDKRIPMEGRRLGIRMDVDELLGLLNAASQGESPTVAVRDGSLILWQLQSKDEDRGFCQHYLEKYLAALDAFRQQDIPIVSYISLPGSHDVANSLRLMLCDRASGGCSRCAQETSEQRLCRFMGSVLDHTLFQGLLDPGERSDIFASQSEILTRYRDHRIQFFYLNVGGEVARIEAPAWVMQDRGMLELVHGVIYDQCRRGGGYPPYPPALIEAHEQAVISVADRRAVEDIVEQAVTAQGIFYLRSAKDRSKRSRGV
jgi:hypothetical protein